MSIRRGQPLPSAIALLAGRWATAPGYRHPAEGDAAGIDGDFSSTAPSARRAGVISLGGIPSPGTAALATRATVAGMAAAR
jgi:hypothetical protein